MYNRSRYNRFSVVTGFYDVSLKSVNRALFNISYNWEQRIPYLLIYGYNEFFLSTFRKVTQVKMKLYAADTQLERQRIDWDGRSSIVFLGIEKTFVFHHANTENSTF